MLLPHISIWRNHIIWPYIWQFGFRVLRGDFGTKFLDPLVADSSHATPGNQQIAIVIFGVDQVQRAMANAAA